MYGSMYMYGLYQFITSGHVMFHSSYTTLPSCYVLVILLYGTCVQVRQVLAAYGSSEHSINNVDPTPIKAAHRRITLMLILIMCVALSGIGLAIINALPASIIDARIVPSLLSLVWITAVPFMVILGWVPLPFSSICYRCTCCCSSSIRRSERVAQSPVAEVATVTAGSPPNVGIHPSHQHQPSKQYRSATPSGHTSLVMAASPTQPIVHHQLHQQLSPVERAHTITVRAWPLSSHPSHHPLAGTTTGSVALTAPSLTVQVATTIL
jgi:hypothetical protein